MWRTLLFSVLLTTLATGCSVYHTNDSSMKRGIKTENEIKNSTYYFTLQLNARLRPLDRGTLYEDPIAEALEADNLGTVDGGGAWLGKNGEVENCDVDIALNGHDKKDIDRLLKIIKEIGVPKGSFLKGDGLELPVGTLEGLAIYMNGTELPDEIYAKCDINYVIGQINFLIEGTGVMYSYWEGPQGTALYYYGSSFDEMKEKMAGFLAEYPLCQKCRIEGLHKKHLNALSVQ